MRSGYVDEATAELLMWGATAPTALCLAIALETGLRMGDVVALRKSHVDEALTRDGRVTVREQKTGNEREITFSRTLLRRLEAQKRRSRGSVWLFPHATKKGEHRTRDSVRKSIKRTCERYHLDPAGVSPHSFRKAYARRLYEQTGKLKEVQKALGHKYEGTTSLYVLSDKVGEKVSRWR